MVKLLSWVCLLISFLIVTNGCTSSVSRLSTATPEELNTQLSPTTVTSTVTLTPTQTETILPSATYTPTSTFTPKPGEGLHIWLNLSPEHLALLRDSDDWIGFLDDLYEVLADLVGGVPYKGSTIEIREVPSFEYWALAGNPIKWNTDYVATEINLLNDNTISWGLPHEISHDFDEVVGRFYVGNVSFVNGEQWANLKLLYALDILSEKYPAIKIYVNYCCYISIDQMGRWFATKFASPFLANTTKDWTNVHHDVITGLLYLVVEDVGWTPFRDTFREYSSSDFNIPRSDYQRISLFLRRLSENSGVDIIAQFLDWGMPTEWIVP